MSNDFQLWLIEQGYYREKTSSGPWYKDGFLVTGIELNDKLNEWMNL